MVVAATVCNAAFVVIKATQIFVAVVVCCFFKDNVLSHNVTVLLVCEGMLVQNNRSIKTNFYCKYYAHKGFYIICNKKDFQNIFLNEIKFEDVF